MKKLRGLLSGVFLLMLSVAKLHAQTLPFLQIDDPHKAANEYGSNDGPVPDAPKNKFTVVVAPNQKPQNFISFCEHYLRTQTVKVDTIVFPLIKKNWKQMTASQKQELIGNEKLHNAILADSVHRLNNTGKQLIYFVNNTGSDVYLQMQDWQFIGVVEALDKNKQWRPVQTWQLSKCGDSYCVQPVKANSTVVFIAPVVNKGAYKTRLRYKVFGADGFLYSNEFEANINYSDFRDESTPYNDMLTFRTISNSKVDLPLTLGTK